MLGFQNLEGKKLVSVIFASQAKSNFHTIHSHRLHGNRSDLEISPLFPQQNWENKFGSTDSQFLFVLGLYAHKLHAPYSHAPCSRSHGSVVEDPVKSPEGTEEEFGFECNILAVAVDVKGFRATILTNGRQRPKKSNRCQKAACNQN